MSKARIWIQEMIDHPEWGRTENKWDAINEIAGLIDKVALLQRENKALVEEGGIKCSEIERLKMQLNKTFDLLDGYNQAFVNICCNHPRITKEEWKEKVMNVV